MRDAAERDPLTGLRNRSVAASAVERALRTAKRSGGSVAVVMIDVDYFKSINDELGHAAGDRALQSLGKALSRDVRAGDAVVRWRGDEFLLVLVIAAGDEPGVNVESIRPRAELSLRRDVPRVEGLGITAGYTVCSRLGAGIDELVADADRALVAGKLVKKGERYGAHDADERRASEGRDAPGDEPASIQP